MTDRLAQVARKDFFDSMREYQIYYVGVVFLLIALGIGYLVGTSPGSGAEISPILAPAYLFLAPVAVLMLSHDAVAGKWATGELTVMLGLPVSRFDVVYGSVIGRTAVVVTATVVSIAVSVIVSTAMGVPPEVDTLAVVLSGLVAMILTFASLAVAFSSLSKSTTISSSAAFGVFVLFVFQLWSLVPGIIDFALDRLGMGSLPEDAVGLWENLPPYAAVRNVAVGVVGEPGEALGLFAPGYDAVNTPIYQTPVFAALVLAFWILVPVTLAYFRFSSADI